MATVGAYEAKTHLSQLLDRVAKGETITITRHGAPVAVLTPAPQRSREGVRKAIEEILEFRKHVKPDPDGWTIKDYINYGRR